LWYVDLDVPVAAAFERVHRREIVDINARVGEPHLLGDEPRVERLEEAHVDLLALGLGGADRVKLIDRRVGDAPERGVPVGLLGGEHAEDRRASRGVEGHRVGPGHERVHRLGLDGPRAGLRHVQSAQNRPSSKSAKRWASSSIDGVRPRSTVKHRFVIVGTRERARAAYGLVVVFRRVPHAAAHRDELELRGHGVEGRLPSKISRTGRGRQGEEQRRREDLSVGRARQGSVGLRSPAEATIARKGRTGIIRRRPGTAPRSTAGPHDADLGRAWSSGDRRVPKGVARG
jgi:hypothetical protein